MLYGFRGRATSTSRSSTSPKSSSRVPSSTGAPLPSETLRGGISLSFLEPSCRSWSHFCGIYCQKVDKLSCELTFEIPPRRALRGLFRPAGGSAWSLSVHLGSPIWWGWAFFFTQKLTDLYHTPRTTTAEYSASPTPAHSMLKGTKNDFFPLSLRNCLRPTVGNSVATPLPFRMVFVGWSLCDDRIQNTQCKVALKRLTATLCSNYVEHIESLRF